MIPFASLRFLNLLSFLFMIALNFLANSLPLNGKTTGELSALYPNLFVPAGFTFSIWGVIYILISIFIIWQFNPKNKSKVEEIGLLFTLTSILNGLWILAWHYVFVELSLVTMLLLLFTLVRIQLSVLISQPVFVRATFGIYLGWICVATIANSTAVLVSHDWNGFGISSPSWVFVLLTIALLLSFFLLNLTKNYAIAWSVMWAFYGIAFKRWADFPEIAWFAVFGIVALVGIQIGLRIKESKEKQGVHFL